MESLCSSWLRRQCRAPQVSRVGEVQDPQSHYSGIEQQEGCASPNRFAARRVVVECLTRDASDKHSGVQRVRRIPAKFASSTRAEDWEGEIGLRFVAESTFVITSLGRHVGDSEGIEEDSAAAPGWVSGLVSPVLGKLMLSAVTSAASSLQSGNPAKSRRIKQLGIWYYCAQLRCGS